MSHYVHSKEGAQMALELTTLKEVDYYIRKAKKANKIPSKIIGGTEYFDIEVLKGYESKEEESSKIQLTLF